MPFASSCILLALAPCQGQGQLCDSNQPEALAESPKAVTVWNLFGCLIQQLPESYLIQIFYNYFSRY
uniref:Uncharacterized protein n=1 Tax=Arundo donax TaxID=35708 RepID=A0A0A9DU76_ARUDO